MTDKEKINEFLLTKQEAAEKIQELSKKK